MRALNEVRRQYREGEVDVVGFYVNPSVDAQVKSIAKAEQYQVTLATVQNMSLGPNALFGQLNDAFRIRGVGRDVYVVDKEGRIQTIRAVDEQGKLRPRPDIVSDVHSALGTVLPPGLGPIPRVFRSIEKNEVWVTARRHRGFEAYSDKNGGEAPESDAVTPPHRDTQPYEAFLGPPIRSDRGRSVSVRATAVFGCGVGGERGRTHSEARWRVDAPSSPRG